MIDFRVSQLAKGILDECHRRNWSMVWREGRSLKQNPRLNQVSGVIARMDKESLLRLRAILSPDIPLISADGSTQDTEIPTITPNPFAIGQVTAEHFLEQGLRSFVLVGSSRHISARYRAEMFSAVVDQALGHAAVEYFNVPENEFLWGPDSVLGRRFIRLLKRIPLPAGVMAASDEAAVSCLECLHGSGIRCPTDVAIVGSSNDPVYTKIVMPLSSIQVDFEKMGAKAVDMLAEIMKSGCANETVKHCRLPVELIIRQSSQVRLMADERIAKGVGILQQRYTEELRLPELAATCGMSRASFCSKFTEAVGISPIRYLIDYRLDKATYLLAESNMTVGQIVEEVGFHELPYFTRAFKQKFQMTPSQYRKQAVQQRNA